MPPPFIPAQGLWLEGHFRPWDPSLSFSLLSVLGEGLQRETEAWGHWHHLGPVEGPVGRLEGTQIPETIGSYMGANLHVKGDSSTRFISINTYDVPVTFLSVPVGDWPGSGAVLCPECGGGTRLPLGATLSGVLNGWLCLLLCSWYTESCTELG